VLHREKLGSVAMMVRDDDDDDDKLLFRTFVMSLIGRPSLWQRGHKPVGPRWVGCWVPLTLNGKCICSSRCVKKAPTKQVVGAKWLKQQAVKRLKLSWKTPDDSDYEEVN
jgi:hypothetical protein